MAHRLLTRSFPTSDYYEWRKTQGNIYLDEDFARSVWEQAQIGSLLELHYENDKGGHFRDCGSLHIEVTESAHSFTVDIYSDVLPSSELLADIPRIVKAKVG